jgi:subtilisin family serine protease
VESLIRTHATLRTALSIVLAALVVASGSAAGPGGMPSAAGPAAVVAGGGQVDVSLAFDPSAREHVLAALAGHGARLANLADGVLEATVAGAAVADLAAVRGVRSVTPIVPPLAALVLSSTAAYDVPAWHTAGLTGSGVKVGIIDLGFRGITALLGTELPASVHARCATGIGAFTARLADCDTGTAHGTAAAELVADLAPKAELFVATWSSPLDTVATVRWMAANGVRVISASFTSGFLFDGPGDGTAGRAGSYYDAVNAAAAAGILWVNSAGNSGDQAWSGAWSDSDADELLNFSGTSETNTVTLAAGQPLAVAMRWADRWGTSANDYDLVLIQGTDVIASSRDRQRGQGDPYEVVRIVAPRAGTYGIRIVRHDAAPNGRIDLLAVSDGRPISLAFRTNAGSLPSPADSASPSEITVGAAASASPLVPRSYSSNGPTLDGRTKPELVAVDCVPTVAYPVFCGTSATAPIVAGAAALALQANPSLTSIQLATDLRARAVRLGGATAADPFGRGLLRLGAAPGPRPTGAVLSALSGSGSAPAAVRPVVALRPSVTVATLSRGTAVRFSATVGPADPDRERPLVAFAIYRLAGTTWVHHRTTNVIASASGLAVLRWTFASTGQWYVRAKALATESSAASVWSVLFKYRVR